MISILIPVIAALKLASAPVGAQPAMHGTSGHRARVAQAQPRVAGAAALTKQAADRLAASQKQQKSIESQMAALRKTYNEQLGEVDKLKRARASWRRDRQLRDQKARSQKTAVALQTLERSLRDQRNVVSRDRKALAQAIDLEVSRGVDGKRQATLSSMLGTLRTNLRAAPKKISMPDLELDEFADPEELLEQIALIERAEAKLASEESSLQKRADHYAHMDMLRSKRIRADEIGDFDDQGVRRSTGRVGSAKDGRTTGAESNDSAGAGLSDSESAPDPGAPPSDDFGGAGGGDFAVTSIVLADVVDAGTQDALRRAQRSTSPRAKADAAKQAKKQVSERLSRLRAGKERIRLHLQRLKK